MLMVTMSSHHFQSNWNLVAWYSMAMNMSTKALQIIKYLERYFNGNQNPYLWNNQIMIIPW
jgi:hypothetical protein